MLGLTSNFQDEAYVFVSNVLPRFFHFPLHLKKQPSPSVTTWNGDSGGKYKVIVRLLSDDLANSALLAFLISWSLLKSDNGTGVSSCSRVPGTDMSRYAMMTSLLNKFNGSM